MEFGVIFVFGVLLGILIVSSSDLGKRVGELEKKVKELHKTKFY